MNIDPHTGEEFTPLRSNQKFASRKNQVGYNNLKAKRIRDAKLSIDKALENNRRILERLCAGEEEKTLSRDYLLGAGLNFTFYSHSVRCNKKVCQVVYNYLIVPQEGNLFTIKKIQ